MDMAELHARASLERKETRGLHIRLDYPEQDPSLHDLLLYQRMEEGKAVVEMRKRIPLNMELREER
jgi:succinate dehydrogenase/fumarate reductase flavoprotein subunit